MTMAAPQISASSLSYNFKLAKPTIWSVQLQSSHGLVAAKGLQERLQLDDFWPTSEPAVAHLHTLIADVVLLISPVASH